MAKKGEVRGVYFPDDVLADMQKISKIYFKGKLSASVVSACRQMIKRVAAEQGELITKNKEAS